MIPKIFQDDTGFYALRYFDSGGSVISPDQDSSLSWEFYDVGDNLRFTATLISTPSIVEDTDNDGDFMKVISIPLTGWDLGLVTVNAFAKKDGFDIEPSPLVNIAFEIIETLTGYCSVQDVVNYTGVKADDLEQDTILQMNAVLGSWILDVSAIIDSLVNTTWSPPETAPLPIKNLCIRAVANMVMISVQRRKSPIMQVGEFSVQAIEDILIGGDMGNIIKAFKLFRPLKLGMRVPNITEE